MTKKAIIAFTIVQAVTQTSHASTCSVFFENGEFVGSAYIHNRAKQRFENLLDAVSTLGSIAIGRPINSVNGPVFNITTVLRYIKFTDIFNKEDIPRVIQMLEDLGLSERPLASNTIVLQNTNKSGLTREIMQYEDALMRVLKYLKSTEGDAAVQVAFALNQLANKYEAYLQLSKVFQEAIKDGFNLISFNTNGLVAPKNTSSSLIGSKILVDVDVSQAALDRKEAQGRLFYVQEIIESTNRSSQEKTQLVAAKYGWGPYPIETLTRLDRNYLAQTESIPRVSGIYRGVLEDVFTSGFVVNVNGEKYTFNVNFGIKFKAIAIRAADQSDQNN